MSVLRFILGDQLSTSLASLVDCDKKTDVVFMCEVHDEATYVPHHQKKLVFILSAMRHFAADLAKRHYHVDYVKLDDPHNLGSFPTELTRAVKRHRATKVIITHPGEQRVLALLQAWAEQSGIVLEWRADTRFLCSLEHFKQWAGSRKQLRLELFYRLMRRELGVLMHDDSPLGGQWNFDKANRKPPSKAFVEHSLGTFRTDEITQEVIDLVSTRYAHHFGDIIPFGYAVTRKQALVALAAFIAQRLPYFGDYQDVMLTADPWLFHAHISVYLNVGLLLPGECIEAAEQAYRQHLAPLNAVEGFIRQILGWREFIRGVYWLKMPAYATLNFLHAKRALPDWYWTGHTDMNCLKQSIRDTQQFAYANHIQRLMVLANFALLIGVHPKHVNEWFLVVYTDAFQWVELPNVSGMALFADGGYFASKPYAASGAYIHRMSDYCASCVYTVKNKTGADACPFNYLYWYFLIKNRAQLQPNPRMRLAYNTLDKMSPAQKNVIQQDAQLFLSQVSGGDAQ